MKWLSFVFITFLVQNLNGQNDTNFTKEIQISNSGRQDSRFSLIRRAENYLNLDTIENGYDSLQIRIWYNFAKGGVGGQLLCLKRQNSSWSATFYSRFTKVNVPIKPKCDWDVLINKLYSYDILNLPDMCNIKGCRCSGIDGWSYSIEISDKHHYRLYSYRHPESFYQQKFKGVRKMMKILKLIRKEFGIKLLGELY